MGGGILRIQDKYDKVGKSKSNGLDKTVILKTKDIETKPVKKRKNVGFLEG